MYDIWICNGFVVIFDGSRLRRTENTAKTDEL